MDLLPVETALGRVLTGVEPLPAERVELAASAGRVLAAAVVARRSQPAFPAASMDGYALRSADTGSAGRLRIVGESAAGQGFAGTLAAGEAVRIFTGAPVPTGADAVLMQESATIDGGNLVVTEAVPAGQFRPAGRNGLRRRD